MANTAKSLSPLSIQIPRKTMQSCIIIFFFILEDYDNLYSLENRALSTSFGKMIPSRNQSNPKYSFGKERRMKSKPIPKTDYMYSPSSEQNYKYIKVL